MVTNTQTNELRSRNTATGVLAAGYGLVCYLAFLAVFVYVVAFLADLVVPRTIDRGGPPSGTTEAVIIDVALLGVFAVQHSVMARPGFKRRWTTVVPAHVERSTYVLAASAALALVVWQWRPLPSVVWEVTDPGARILLWALYLAGWIWVVAMTFAIDHFDLVGLRQVGRHLRGLADLPPTFVLPLPHRLVRHPMMLGFFPAFLAAPTMTVGHLLFAGLGCACILFGVRLEERDLTRTLSDYAAYAAVTPRFIPVSRLAGVEANGWVGRGSCASLRRFQHAHNEPGPKGVAAT